MTPDLRAKVLICLALTAGTAIYIGLVAPPPTWGFWDSLAVLLAAAAYLYMEVDDGMRGVVPASAQPEQPLPRPAVKMAPTAGPLETVLANMLEGSDLGSQINRLADALAVSMDAYLVEVYVRGEGETVPTRMATAGRRRREPSYNLGHVVTPDHMKAGSTMHTDSMAGEALIPPELKDWAATEGVTVVAIQCGQNFIVTAFFQGAERLNETVRLFGSLKGPLAKVITLGVEEKVLDEQRHELDLAQRLATAKTPEDGLQAVLSQVTDVPWDMAVLAYPVNNRQLSLAIQNKVPGAQLAVWKNMPSEGSCPGTVIEKGQPVVESDLRDALDYSEDGVLSADGFAARLCMPTVHNTTTNGALVLLARTPGTLHAEHADKLEHVAEQLGNLVARFRSGG